MDQGAETDRLRTQFLSAELDLRFTFAQMAQAEYQTGDPQHARESLADAERGYETVTRFLADRKHADHLTDDQLTRLRERMQQLRDVIDGVNREGAGTTPAAERSGT